MQVGALAGSLQLCQRALLQQQPDHAWPKSLPLLQQLLSKQADRRCYASRQLLDVLYLSGHDYVPVNEPHSGV